MLRILKDLFQPNQPQEANMFGRPKQADVIRESMNRMKTERMENATVRNGVIKHPDGRLEQYTEQKVERGHMTEVVVAGEGDFFTAAKTFAITTTPVATMLPNLRPASTDEVVRAVEQAMIEGGITHKR